MKKVTLDDILSNTVPDQPTSPYGDIKVWDDQPGGKIVSNFTDGGVDYVYVEFSNSPGEQYLFRAK